jgi:hypothetical protein
MIGGTDVVIPATGDVAALDTCARIIQRYWPRARFEDAITGKKYGSYGDIPVGGVRELFAYPDASAEAAWDTDDAVAERNTMIYLILTPEAVTAVLDDPHAPDMRSILDSIRNALSTKTV